MLKSLFISSIAALGFLVTILLWEASGYDGTTAQLSLLHADSFVEPETVEAEFDLSIERPAEELEGYSVLNVYGEVVPYEEFETLSLNEAAAFLYYIHE